MDYFTQWRHFLEGSSNQVAVFSDHKNIAYFQSGHVLNRRQARWAQLLTRFDFIITYPPGKQQGKADALSQHSYLAPCPGESTFDNQMQVILGLARLQATQVFGMPFDSHNIDTICEDLNIYAFAQAILLQVDPKPFWAFW